LIITPPASVTFLIQVLADYHVHPALWTTAGVEPETHMLTAGTATAGSLTNWLRDLMGGPDFDTLKGEAADVPLGTEGLLCCPTWPASARRFSIPTRVAWSPGSRGGTTGTSVPCGVRGHCVRDPADPRSF
jgi:sugar (pentulose or hexulose) kinase